MSPGGTGAVTQALSTPADLPGDPQNRLPVASAVLLQSVWRILRLQGEQLHYVGLYTVCAHSVSGDVLALAVTHCPRSK